MKLTLTCTDERAVRKNAYSEPKPESYTLASVDLEGSRDLVAASLHALADTLSPPVAEWEARP